MPQSDILKVDSRLPLRNQMLFLYLHGFNSSPESIKAKKIQTFLNKIYPTATVIMPQLSIDPVEVSAMLNDILNKEYPDEFGLQKFIIGSSLGGLMARNLMETRTDTAGAILINPALRADKLIKQIPLQQYNIYLDKHYTINQKHLDYVKDLMCDDTKDESKYLLLCQEDDEECLWSDSRDILPNADFYLEKGQGHGFEEIEVTFGAIKEFLDSRINS